MKSGEFKIIDNYVPNTLFEYYYNNVNSVHFPWHYRNNITQTYASNFSHDGKALPSYERQYEKGYNFGYSTSAFTRKEENAPPSDFHLLMLPLLLIIQEENGAKDVIRARFDMTTKTPTLHMHDPHVDCDKPNIACILYFNETDGDTVLFNEKMKGTTEIPKEMDLTIKKAITPKMNRLLMFDGELIHTGHSPMNYSNRILLNINYII